MIEMTGVVPTTCVAYSEFKNHVNEVVSIKGAIHNIRDMSDFAFIIIRTARELVQCVYSPDFSDYRMDESVVEQAAAKITGLVVKSETRDGSERYELQITKSRMPYKAMLVVPELNIFKKTSLQCVMGATLFL